MFKRPRLSAQSFPVNAGLAGFLLFYAVSCSGPQEATETPAESTETTAVAPSTDRDATQNALPAVWSTRTLDFPVRSLAIAGAAGSNFAVAYEGGGLQLFNFDGERITSVSDHDVKMLAEGRYALLSGTPVTIYPGIDTLGDLKVWIYGGGLSEAIQYDLKGNQTGSAAGLCAAAPGPGQSGIVHQLAYWTDDAPRTLKVGVIVESEGELNWTSQSELMSEAPISACTITSAGPETFTDPVAGASGLSRHGRELLVTLSSSGDVAIRYPAGESQGFDILDGITVVVPDEPAAIAATGDARGGGYPGGLIILGGETTSTDYRVVLVDPSKVTLTAISIPPASE